MLNRLYERLLHQGAQYLTFGALVIGCVILLPIVIWVCPLTNWLIGNHSYYALRLVPAPIETYNSSEATTDGFNGKWRLLEVALEPEQIISFYQSALPQQGWHIETSVSEPWQCIEAHNNLLVSVNISVISIRGTSSSRVIVDLPPRKTRCQPWD